MGPHGHERRPDAPLELRDASRRTAAGCVAQAKVDRRRVVPRQYANQAGGLELSSKDRTDTEPVLHGVAKRPRIGRRQRATHGHDMLFATAIQ